MTETETIKGGPTLRTFTDQQLLEELVRRYVDRAQKKRDEMKPCSDAKWWIDRELIAQITATTYEMRRMGRERLNG